MLLLFCFYSDAELFRIAILFSKCHNLFEIEPRLLFCDMLAVTMSKMWNISGCE